MTRKNVVWTGVIGLGVGFIACWVLLANVFGYQGPKAIAEGVQTAQMDVHASYCVLAATDNITGDTTDGTLLALAEAGSNSSNLRAVVARWADESGNSRWDRQVADVCAAQLVEMHGVQIAAAVVLRDESVAAAAEDTPVEVEN